MEFKKCLRCGSFFMSNDNICCNCVSKDKQDISKLNDFISDNNYASIQDLSDGTGISLNNLNRFIQNNNIPNLNIK